MHTIPLAKIGMGRPVTAIYAVMHCVLWQVHGEALQSWAARHQARSAAAATAAAAGGGRSGGESDDAGAELDTTLAQSWRRYLDFAQAAERLVRWGNGTHRCMHAGCDAAPPGGGGAHQSVRGGNGAQFVSLMKLRALCCLSLLSSCARLLANFVCVVSSFRCYAKSRTLALRQRRSQLWVLGC